MCDMPCFITFYNDFLYKCVIVNNNNNITSCIVKIDSKFENKSKYYLDFQTDRITIIDNIACVIQDTNEDFPTVNFYQLMDFKKLYQYKNDSSFCLPGVVYRDNFFILNLSETKFDCYNKNGALVDSVGYGLSSRLTNDWTDDCFYPFLAIHNDKLFVHINEKKIHLF
jgi:hypothetical protein